jgi:hypothetical protein
VLNIYVHDVSNRGSTGNFVILISVLICEDVSTVSRSHMRLTRNAVDHHHPLSDPVISLRNPIPKKIYSNQDV